MRRTTTGQHPQRGVVLKHVHDACQLRVLTDPGKDGQTDKQFRGDATNAPHVNGVVVGNTQHHFGGAVKPGLNVGVDGLAIKTRAAQINHFDFRQIFVGRVVRGGRVRGGGGGGGGGGVRRCRSGIALVAWFRRSNFQQNVFWF